MSLGLDPELVAVELMDADGIITRNLKLGAKRIVTHREGGTGAGTESEWG